MAMMAMMARALCGVAAVLLACSAREQGRSVVARGEYLSKLMGCPACHSSDPARPYAGGLEAREPNSVWRAPNITPHTGTGIGAWTDAQIIAAVRDGVRPDGRALHPIMPYRYYRRLTDGEAQALVAFLRSLAPIVHAVAPAPPPADLPIAAAVAPPSPSPGGELARRGEHLVALMHCASCHATPGADGQPDPARPFAGGKRMRPFGAGLASVGSGALIAPNITPDRETGIGAWTAGDLARSLRGLVRPDGTPIRGPMELYAAGWSVVTDCDLAAIAAYLQELPPVHHRVPAADFTPRGAAP